MNATTGGLLPFPRDEAAGSVFKSLDPDPRRTASLGPRRTAPFIPGLALQ
jgi:hypothetical protein